MENKEQQFPSRFFPSSMLVQAYVPATDLVNYFQYGIIELVRTHRLKRRTIQQVFHGGRCATSDINSCCVFNNYAPYNYTVYSTPRRKKENSRKQFEGQLSLASSRSQTFYCYLYMAIVPVDLDQLPDLPTGERIMWNEREMNDV